METSLLRSVDVPDMAVSESWSTCHHCTCTTLQSSSHSTQLLSVHLHCHPRATENSPNGITVPACPPNGITWYLCSEYPSDSRTWPVCALRVVLYLCNWSYLKLCKKWQLSVTIHLMKVLYNPLAMSGGQIKRPFIWSKLTITVLDGAGNT